MSTQDNAKLLQLLKSGFKRTINWNKYQSKVTIHEQPVKINLRTDDNIRKIATGQRDDYTTVCSLDYPYFKNYYEMIAISKKQALDADPKAIEQINFTANLDQPGNSTMFFIFEEAKKNILDFSKGIVKVL